MKRPYTSTTTTCARRVKHPLPREKHAISVLVASSKKTSRQGATAGPLDGILAGPEAWLNVSKSILTISAQHLFDAFGIALEEDKRKKDCHIHEQSDIIELRSSDTTDLRPLANVVIEREEFYGGDAKDFMKLFFDDGAKYSMENFHVEGGDQKVHFGPWRGALHRWSPSLQDIFATVLTDPNLERRGTFVTPIRLPTISHSNSRVSIAQTLTESDEQQFTVESVLRLLDVPYSECFHIMVRHIVANEAGMDLTTLRIEYDVQFTKKCRFKERIEKMLNKKMAKLLMKWLCYAQDGWDQMHQTRGRGDSTSRHFEITSFQSIPEWHHLNGSIGADSADVSLLWCMTEDDDDSLDGDSLCSNESNLGIELCLSEVEDAEDMHMSSMRRASF